MNKKENKTIDLRGTPAFDRMKNYLASYKNCKRVCEQYAEERKHGTVMKAEEDVRDAFFSECRARCNAIEAFILSVNCGNDERRLLWFHYVEGMSIETAAEKLYVSRSTAFRISKRAEEAALFDFVRLEGEQSSRKRSVS